MQGDFIGRNVLYKNDGAGYNGRRREAEKTQKEFDLRSLWRENFMIRGLYTFRQHFPEGSVYTFRGNARPENGLTALCGCDAVYETRSGQTVRARCGDVVFVSMHSGYTVHFSHRTAHPLSNYLINFRLLDEDENEMYPRDEVINLTEIDRQDAAKRIAHICTLDEGGLGAPCEIKGLLYLLLVNLSRQTDRGGAAVPMKLRPALEMLTQPEGRNLTVTGLASACGMSESGFRRLFRDTFGVSPVHYRQDRLLEEAKRLMDAGMQGVGEIAGAVGMEDANYFTRLFRLRMGMTPGEYMKNE